MEGAIIEVFGCWNRKPDTCCWPWDECQMTDAKWWEDFFEQVCSSSWADEEEWLNKYNKAKTYTGLMHLPNVSLDKFFKNKQKNPKPLSQKISVKAEGSVWKSEQRMFFFSSSLPTKSSNRNNSGSSKSWHLKGNLQLKHLGRKLCSTLICFSDTREVKLFSPPVNL